MLFNKIRLTCALCWMLIGALPAFAQTPKTEEMRDLTANHKLELTIGGGEAHHFQIRLNGGQFVRVIADQRSVDVVLSLFAPDGKLIYERDRPNGKEGEESLSAEVTTGGIYRLEVRALKKDAPVGKYELRSEVPRSPTQNDKRRISAEQALHEAEKLIAAPTIQSLREASAKYTQAGGCLARIRRQLRRDINSGKPGVRAESFRRKTN